MVSSAGGLESRRTLPPPANGVNGACERAAIVAERLLHTSPRVRGEVVARSAAGEGALPQSEPSGYAPSPQPSPRTRGEGGASGARIAHHSVRRRGALLAVSGSASDGAAGDGESASGPAGDGDACAASAR